MVFCSREKNNNDIMGWFLPFIITLMQAFVKAFIVMIYIVRELELDGNVHDFFKLFMDPDAIYLNE